jgi:hypothetical protein
VSLEAVPIAIEQVGKHLPNLEHLTLGLIGRAEFETTMPVCGCSSEDMAHCNYLTCKLQSAIHDWAKDPKWENDRLDRTHFWASWHKLDVSRQFSRRDTASS